MLSNTFETVELKSMKWYSNDHNVARVASGIYFVIFKVNNQRTIQKILLIN